jgi:predicted DNA-binding protein
MFNIIQAIELIKFNLDEKISKQDSINDTKYLYGEHITDSEIEELHDYYYGINVEEECQNDTSYQYND